VTGLGLADGVPITNGLVVTVTVIWLGAEES
jgi:hypothetical protein